MKYKSRTPCSLEMAAVEYLAVKDATCPCCDGGEANAECCMCFANMDRLWIAEMNLRQAVKAQHRCETSSKRYEIRRGQATAQLYVVDKKEGRYVLVTPTTDIEDMINKIMGEDAVGVSLCPDWIVFAREKIREFETENARLKIENRRLIADKNEGAR